MILARRARRREPVGALPAELLAKDGAQGAQPVVARRGAVRAAGRAFLVRIMHREDVGVRLLVFRPQVGAGGVGPEAARIHVQHVDGRLALHDPLRKLPAGAAGGGDAERLPLVQPEVGQAPSGADQRVAVRRERNGAAVHALDAQLAKRRHAANGGFDVRREAVEVGVEEFVFALGMRAVRIAGGSAVLVRAQHQPARFLAHVPGAVGFAQYRQFRQPRLAARRQLRVCFGDDVLVLHRQHGNVQPHQRASAPRETAGGADDVLAHHVALVRRHPPLPGPSALDARHAGLPLNRRALGAGAAGERLGQVRGLDVAVLRVADRAHQTFRGGERPDFPHLLGGQKLHLHADGAGDAGVLPVLVHAVRRHRQADVADVAPAHVLARFLLQGAVELYGILVQLAHRIAHVEERQQTGRVPRGSGGELLALEQQRVRPAFARQVVQRGDAHHAASDHHHPRRSRHGSR